MKSDQLRWRSVVPALTVLSAIPLVLSALTVIPGRLDRRLYDAAAHTVLQRAPTNENLVFVDIDDESLQELGERWPISRLTWARLVRSLTNAQPRAVGLDAFFPEPNNRGEVELALDTADRIRDAGLDGVDAGEKIADYLDKQAGLRDADRQLSNALADAGNVVLGLVDEGRLRIGSEPPLLLPVPGAVTPTNGVSTLIAPQGSIPRFADAAATQASLYVPYDPDGVVRRYHYLYRHKQFSVASLALATVQVAYPKRAVALGNAAAQLREATSLLRYPVPAQIKRVKLVDVLSAEPENLKKLLQGRVIFVGVSAIGAADRRPTPVDSQLPGTMIHIAAAAELLSGHLIETHGTGHTLASLTALLLALLVIFAAGKVDHTGLSALAGLSFLVAWTGAAVLLADRGIFVPVAPTWLAVTVPLAGTLMIRSILSEAGRKRIRKAFTHYLDPAVVEELVADPERLKLGGERREITAFFSDIAGFTSISEALDPADLVALLNEYLSAMTTIIVEEGGIIDKYIGDAVVAMFGAPSEQPDHAERACRAAIRCHARLAEMRVDWKARAMPEIRARIGVNSGVAVVGNMGSAERFDYTMMGDMVNLAARLESANKQFATELMVGEKTVAMLQDQIALRELDTIAVKGKVQGITVYEILGFPKDISPDEIAKYSAFSQGLRAWRRRDWQGARENFAQAEAAGDDTAAIFLARLDAIAHDPPPPGWDGVYRMTSK